MPVFSLTIIKAPLCFSYDYSHVFTDEVVRHLQVMGIGEGTTNPSSASSSASSLDNFPDSENRRAYAKKVAEQAVGNHIILDWINAESVRADAHIDPYGGAPLSKFLPAHNDSTELSSLSKKNSLLLVFIYLLHRILYGAFVLLLCEENDCTAAALSACRRWQESL